MGERIKVVMVDDEPDLCLMVKENLEETGRFEVSTSSRPEEVEKVVQQANPDIILLDVVMPKRKGTDIVAALKKNSATKTLPIIMVSGKGEMVYNKRKDEFKWLPNNPLAKERGQLPEGKGSEALTEAYGVQDYISKPFKTELLVQVIDEVLAKAKKRQPSTEEGTG